MAIRVNAVSPAGVRTPMWRSLPFFRNLVEEAGSEEAAFATLKSGPGGRFADVVAVILFLSSDESRFVIGVDLLIDGGYVL